MKDKFGDKAQLLFTDTDSLMYEVECEDIYQTMSSGRFDWFDMSNFSQDHPKYFFDMQENKAKVGMMKDECAGQPIVEFVGLRPKMYSFTSLEKQPDGTLDLAEKHRAKGIQRVAAARLTHEQYREQLVTPMENYVTNRRLGSRLHNIYGIEVSCDPFNPSLTC